MGHSRRRALALIDLWVMQRAQPRGPLEGSLGCKYTSVFLLHTLDRHTDKGGSWRTERDRGGRETGSASFCHSPSDLAFTLYDRISAFLMLFLTRTRSHLQDRFLLSIFGRCGPTTKYR